MYRWLTENRIAQVKVTGGSGSANPTNALIPGAFKDTDPGYTANVSSSLIDDWQSAKSSRN